MKNCWRLSLLLLSVFTVKCQSTAPPAISSEYPQPGCSFSMGMSSGGWTGVYRSLVILREIEGVDEDGAPLEEYEVWYSDSPELHKQDKNNQIVGVNIKKSKVLKAGEVRIYKAVRVRCPWW